MNFSREEPQLFLYQGPPDGNLINNWIQFVKKVNKKKQNDWQWESFLAAFYYLLCSSEPAGGYADYGQKGCDTEIE